MYGCIRSSRGPELPLAVAKDFSPRWQRHGRAGVVLDLGGLGRLLGDAHAIGAELDRDCAARCADRAARASVSIAIAPTQASALLVAAAGTGLRIVTGDLAAALAPIPLKVLHQLLAEMLDVTVLRSKRPGRRTPQLAQWEAYDQSFDVFERWGLTTLGELAALPGGDLSARLGQGGVALQMYARGIDRGPLVPDPDVPRFLERMELEWPIDGLEPLAFVLARLLDPLSLALERADRGAAAIRLHLRLVDRTEHARVLQLPAAMRDARVLRTLVVLDLESHPPPAAIDIVTIEIVPAPARIVQYSLLERARPSAETLATLTARLGALSGDSRVGCARLLDSHQPDGFEMSAYAPPELRRDRSAFAPTERRRDRAADAPTELRRESEPPISIRRFRPPIAIRVAVERGRPVRVAIDRRGMPGGRVEQSAGPWRSSGAWWDRDARQWNRDEWDLALGDGSVCRVFRDRLTGAWFMEGTID
jgi:protein ImuB